MDKSETAKEYFSKLLKALHYEKIQEIIESLQGIDKHLFKIIDERETLEQNLHRLVRVLNDYVSQKDESIRYILEYIEVFDTKYIIRLMGKKEVEKRMLLQFKYAIKIYKKHEEIFALDNVIPEEIGDFVKHTKKPYKSINRARAIAIHKAKTENLGSFPPNFEYSKKLIIRHAIGVFKIKKTIAERVWRCYLELSIQEESKHPEDYRYAQELFKKYYLDK